MTLPPNIRINVGAPFPARVQGSGPIVVTKLNGIWTISINIANLAVQTAPNLQNDYVFIYDAVVNAFFKIPLGILGSGKVQRSVVTTPIIIASSDQVLNCNIPAPAACALPSAASRLGIPLSFKDVGAQFAANNLTITPSGADTIDGAGSLVLRNNRQGVTLVPLNDTVNSGWEIL